MYQKTFPIHKELFYDVAVIGGGTAGPFAAICAAKNGAKTVLIEKTSALGGTMTNCRVNFPGLFFAWGKQIIDGPCYEAILKTAKLGGASIPEIVFKPERHWHQQILVNPFIYTSVVEKMCLGSGVTLLYHTMIAACEKEDKQMTVYAVGKEGMFAIHAKRIIDCTGDADIVQMLGYAVETGTVLQPATLTNEIAGYDIESIDADKVEKAYRAALENGTVTEADFQGSGPMATLREHRVKLHVSCEDTSSSFTKSKLESEARGLLLKDVMFLRSIPGLENLYVSFSALECGVRESVRIVGETQMTADNYVSGYCYPDAISYCYYPVDRHTPTGIKQVFHEENVVPTIPYGALLPKGAEYIIVAGRCAAGDRDANSGYRVQAPCMSMGQTAGTAAALSVQKDCSLQDLPLDLLRSALRDIGAIVP